MKNTPLLLASLIIAFIFVFMACENASHKMERAESPVMKSDRNVDMTESEVLAEVQIFRFKTSNDIKANFRKIASIQDIIDTRDESLRENDEDKLEALDNANREMKRSIDKFNESGRDQWMIFKDDFSDSMNGLAHSLDSFFDSTNTKSVNF